MTNLSKYNQLCFIFVLLPFFYYYESIQLSYLMNVNICYSVFNFPKKNGSSVCQSVRNKNSECMPLEGKADLCLSGQENLFGCISSLWWHMGQLGALRWQDSHEFNQLDGTNSHREWDNKYQHGPRPTLTYLYWGWCSHSTHWLFMLTMIFFLLYFACSEILYVAFTGRKKKLIPSFPYSNKADLWVGFCQPDMMVWNFNLKSVNGHSKGDGRGSVGLWSMVLVKASRILHRCPIVQTATL